MAKKRVSKKAGTKRIRRKGRMITVPKPGCRWIKNGGGMLSCETGGKKRSKKRSKKRPSRRRRAKR